MKKLFLIVAVVLFNLTSFSQVSFIKEKINTDDLIGYWQPDQESVQLFFWKDTLGKLQMQEISGTSGNPLDILSFKINENSVYAKTIFESTMWTTENVFTFINKTTLKCVVTGDGFGTIIYKKIK